MTICVQMYSAEHQIRAFDGSRMIFEANNVDWRLLDALGLPRIGRGGPWQRTEWGHELEGRFGFRIRAQRMPQVGG